MDDVTITIPGTKLQEALIKCAEDVFKSSYDSPIHKVMKAAIADREGQIKKMVDDVITQALSDADFKARMGDIVLRGMIESAMKRYGGNMSRTDKVIEVHPEEVECYVCHKVMPTEVMQYLGDNYYRCKKHRTSTIVKAGELHKQEKATRKWVITGEISATFSITIEEVRS